MNNAAVSLVVDVVMAPADNIAAMFMFTLAALVAYWQFLWLKRIFR